MASEVRTGGNGAIMVPIGGIRVLIKKSIKLARRIKVEKTEVQVIPGKDWIRGDYHKTRESAKNWAKIILDTPGIAGVELRLSDEGKWAVWYKYFVVKR